MFQRILEMFTDGIDAVGSFMVDLFNNLVAIFYVNGNLTFYGIIFLIMLVLSIIIFVLGFLFNNIGLGGGDDEE